MLVLIGPGLTKFIVTFFSSISLDAVIVIEFKDAFVELYNEKPLKQFNGAPEVVFGKFKN